MAEGLAGSTDLEKLTSLGNFTHKEQTIWVLNGFWEEFGQEKAEQFWQYLHKYVELDLENGENGHELDELQTHRFLEAFDETLTVRDMREQLRTQGIEKVRFVPIVNFFICKYKLTYQSVVHSIQGDNKEEIARAQAKLDAAQAACAQAQEKASAARIAVVEAKNKENAAHDAIEVAKQKEQESVVAQQELEAALAEVKKEEDAYNAKTAELQSKAEAGGVSGLRAKNELAQHLGEDPLPLRRAKITAEAAVKKAERARKAASEAVTRSEEAAQAASEARQRSEQAEQAAADALRAAEESVKEAEDFLNEVKAKPGGGKGALWWMERELVEAKKYMPLSRGGIARN